MSRRRKGRNNGKISITIIVCAFLIVMAIQIVQLKKKDTNYAKEETQKRQEYESETQRASELAELEEYMQSTQYIEDLAKSKLGLVYENEIIYKESK